ncbi:Butirosin biosynthesis, BtrG-like protein, partial [Russula earlei]
TALKPPRTLYFAYGSNLWIDQMNRRCPENRYVGTAVLQGWRWIINQMGYATIIPFPGDHVYGFIFDISPTDEKSLDKYERVPYNYEKRIISVQPITSSDDRETATNRAIDTLVYIDVLRTSSDVPKTEYIDRMNKALEDAIQKDVPQSYIEKYIRPFIPPE